MIIPWTLQNNWKWSTLEEVAAKQPNAIVDGPFGSNLKVSDYVAEGIPVFQGKNITDDRFCWSDIRFVSLEKATELKRSSVHVGDLLIVKIGSIGYSAIIDDLRGYPFALIPANLAKLTPASDVVHTPYLAHWLKSTPVKQHLQGSASQTAQPALSLGKLKAVPIPLPPLPEQRRIADILDKADAIRRKRQEATEQIQVLPLSRFYEMFGNPIINDFGWPLQEIGEVTKVTKLAGFEYTKHFTYREHGEVIAIRGVNVKKGRLKLDDVHYIDREVSEKLPRSRLYEGDIVMTYIGVNMGDVAYVPVSDKYHLGPNVAKITSLEDRTLNPLYLMQFLAIYKSEIARKATNTAKAAFNMGNIRQVHIPMPPGELQTRFAKLYVSSQASLDRFDSTAKAADELFNSLVQRAFRGEL